MTDKVKFYKDDSGFWRWRRVAQNGRIIADGSEGYGRLADVRRAAERALSSDVHIDWVVIEEDQ